MAEVKEEKVVVETEAEVKKAPRKKATPKTEGEATAKKTTKKSTKKAEAVVEAPVVEAVAEAVVEEVVATEPVVKAKKEYPQPLIINGKYVAEKNFAKQYEKGDKPYEIGSKQIKVTLVKSTAGSLVEHQRTVKALGLTKIRSYKIHNDNAAIRGMIFKVKHLVTVEEVK